MNRIVKFIVNLFKKTDKHIKDIASGNKHDEEYEKWLGV